MVENTPEMMVVEIARFIKEFRKKQDLSRYSETDTKQSIQRIIQLLDWDPFDVEEVKMEYSIDKIRVDFALKVDDQPKVFIEAKKFSENISEHEKQLITYATRESVRIAILTNGITWTLFLPLVEGNWKDKKFYTIDIKDQEPKQAADKFVKFLSRQMTVSGESVRLAERIFNDEQRGKRIYHSLRIGWNKIIEKPDERLVKLIQETVEKRSGYEVDEDTIVEFIENNQANIAIAGQPPKKQIQAPKKEKTTETKTDTEVIPTRKKRPPTKLHATIEWKFVGKNDEREFIADNTAVKTFITLLEIIGNEVGMDEFAKLLEYRVNRGMLLANEPSDYYKWKVFDYFVITKNSTSEKEAIINEVVEFFNLPNEFIKIRIV